MGDGDLRYLPIGIREWSTLARRLEFLAGDIEEFDLNNRRFSEKVQRMLIAWKQREGSGATYRVLYDALCDPLVNRRDLAEKFCTYWDSFLVST